MIFPFVFLNRYFPLADDTIHPVATDNAHVTTLGISNSFYHSPRITEKQILLWSLNPNEQYKKLNLSDEQRKVITLGIAAIQAQESAYTAVASAWVCNAVFCC